MRRPLLLLLFGALVAAKMDNIDAHHRRNKKEDLIDITSIGDSCEDSYTGFAYIDGSLEKCDMYKEVQSGSDQLKAQYDEYKCNNLKVHSLWDKVNGKCSCKPNFEGPICNVYKGCPDNSNSFNIRLGVCTANPCEHGGQLGIGSTGYIECSCPEIPWSGRFCHSPICSRLAPPGASSVRFVKKTNVSLSAPLREQCICGQYFTGENCDVITGCHESPNTKKPTGEFVNGICMCNERYGGEICEIKCKPGELTCSSSLLSISASFVLAALVRQFF